jgi:putative flippase GtrA
VIARQRRGELIRYLVTGALGASLNVAITVLLTEYVGLNYLVSLTICGATVIVVGFFLNRNWTFRKPGPAAVTEFARYALVTGINVPIGLVACAFLVEVVKIRYTYSIVIVAAAFAPLTFVIHRAWTFGLSWMRSH